MKMEVGTVLSFNESGFVMAVRAWDKFLIAVNEALIVYNSFGIGLANKEICRDIVNGSIQKIKLDFESAIESQMKKSKFPMVTIMNAIDTVEKQLNNLFFKIEKISQVRNGLHSDQLDLDYISITTGLAVLSKEAEQKIRDSFTVKIENDKQVDFFVLVENLSDAYEKVREYWNQNSSHPIDDSREMIGGDLNDILTEIDNKLVFDMSFLNRIGSKAAKSIMHISPKNVTEAELLGSTKEELAAAKERGPRIGDPDTHLVNTW